MSIGFLIGQLAEGGAERQVFLIARELNQLGERVLVITNQPGGYFQKKLQASGIQVAMLTPHGGTRIQRLSRLLQICRLHNLDTLFCFGTAEAYYGRLALMRHKTLAIPCLRNQVWSGQTGLWVDRMLKIITPCYVTNSYAGSLYLENAVGVPRTKIHEIRNALPSKEIIAIGKDMQDPRPPGDGDEIWCGWVGSLLWRKDPELLIQVADRACSLEKRLRVIVIGDGPLRQEFKRQIVANGLEQRVYSVGKIERAPGVWRYLDFGLSTSRIEGTPNVLMEAMVWGKPYVAPPVGDYPVLIKHQENGLLSQDRSVEALADLTLQLTRDEKLRARLSRGALETARDFETPAQIAQQYLELCQRIRSQ